MGLYQSVVEQEYGPDEQTGKWWGYYENRPAIAYPNQTFDGENLTDSKRYNYGAEAADYTYVKDVSGIYYHFELPDGTYDVKLGFYNDWSGRSVDIVLEDQTVGRGVYLTQNSKVEKRYAIEVVDGELNVKIHNPNRTNQYEDALLSYIIVEVPIRYDAALLKALVKEYSLTDEERAIYSASTLEKYDEAWYYADKVANNPQADSFSTTKIKSYYDKLQLKYRCLREKGEIKTYTSITGTGVASGAIPMVRKFRRTVGRYNSLLIMEKQSITGMERTKRMGIEVWMVESAYTLLPIYIIGRKKGLRCAT